MPERIQRKRAKGWRMPPGAVYVGRPSRWGNPFAVTKTFEGVWAVIEPDDMDRVWVSYASQPHALRQAVELYRIHTGPMGNHEFDTDDLLHLRSELAGKDLVCWCPLDQPCHADVLLEIANEKD
jgi:uncharacterized protein DUF4326